MTAVTRSGKRMVKVVCRPNKRERHHYSTDKHVRGWKSTLPFNVNPRGILVHRVRDACSIFYDGSHSHDAVHYWCGNVATGHGVSLTDQPPENRLLCEACETKATEAGEPSAEKLCGRHIHTGVLRAQRTCCPDTHN